MNYTSINSRELSGTSSYNELKETFEKSTDLDFDKYVEVINEPPFVSNKRFIIFDRLWYQNEKLDIGVVMTKRLKYIVIVLDSFHQLN
jgi:hypothetical protein